MSMIFNVGNISEEFGSGDSEVHEIFFIAFTALGFREGDFEVI
jgi:hypothetical protein